MLVMVLAAGAVADEHPLPNPEILRQQFEAQERERAINRQRDYQLAHAAAVAPAAPAPEVPQCGN
jgi:hypothetical protein